MSTPQQKRKRGGDGADSSCAWLQFPPAVTAPDGFDEYVTCGDAHVVQRELKLLVHSLIARRSARTTDAAHESSKALLHQVAQVQAELDATRAQMLERERMAVTREQRAADARVAQLQAEAREKLAVAAAEAERTEARAKATLALERAAANESANALRTLLAASARERAAADNDERDNRDADAEDARNRMLHVEEQLRDAPRGSDTCTQLRNGEAFRRGMDDSIRRCWRGLLAKDADN